MPEMLGIMLTAPAAPDIIDSVGVVLDVAKQVLTFCTQAPLVYFLGGGLVVLGITIFAAARRSVG